MTLAKVLTLRPMGKRFPNLPRPSMLMARFFTVLLALLLFAVAMDLVGKAIRGLM